MAERNRDYWAARAAEREREAYLRGSKLSAQLYREYQRAVRELRRSVSDFYGRYGDKYGLSYEQAVKKLSLREMREWRASLGDYVAEINAAADAATRERLIARLDALSANSRISRLEALMGDAQAQMDRLYGRCRAEMAQELGGIYAESYYSKHYDLQSRAGRIRNIAALTPETIEDAASYPWSGADFSDRLWRNKENLLFNVRETLTQGLIQGRSLPETSKELAARMGQSYKAAERLVQTEANHLHNRANLAAYAAAGVDQYEFMATLDSRTCPVCGALDGKRFRCRDAAPGENFPPMHPRDRCTTVEWDPEEAVDRAVSGEKMPEDMTYGEWKKKQFTANRKAGIIDAGGDGMDVDIEIDQFTPCLMDTETGKLVDTTFSSATANDLRGTKGWGFDWTDKALDQDQIYKLTLSGDSEVQGLVAFRQMERDKAVYVHIAESAPHNFGAKKRYSGVGGHLFAIAARKSVEAGYGGYFFMDAKNRDLVKHYQDTLGAMLLGMPHEYRMIVDEDAALKLLRIYNFEEDMR